MGNLISKKKVSLNSIRIAVNKAFISFGQHCDLKEMNKLNLEASTQNIAPPIFTEGNLNFTFDCIDDQFNNAEFYNFLIPEIINLAKTETVAIFGGLDAPPSFAEVEVNEETLKDAVFRMYYNLNNECSILGNGTLIDFNIDGSYNSVTFTTANQTMNSFGTCQLSQSRQDKVIQTFQNIIDASTTVSHSWVVTVFLTLSILLILFVIFILIFAGVSAGTKKSSTDEFYSRRSYYPYYNDLI